MCGDEFKDREDARGYGSVDWLKGTALMSLDTDVPVARVNGSYSMDACSMG